MKLSSGGEIAVTYMNSQTEAACIRSGHSSMDGESLMKSYFPLTIYVQFILDGENVYRDVVTGKLSIVL